MALKKIYKFAVIATDVAIFTIDQGELKVLLIQMKKTPYQGKWALPGGLIGPRESLDEAAERNLREKTGVKNAYLEQLYTFGEVDRDPFGRVVSVAYIALLPSANLHLATTADYGEVAWFPVSRPPALAYDHAEVLRTALERLRAKIEYTNMVYGLLPGEFTLGELQKVYEIILGRRLDKRNFRKKILELRIVRPTGRMKKAGPMRPAALYEFQSKKPQVVEMI
jgi:8-oxo-dGTP diphosphatase